VRLVSGAAFIYREQQERYIPIKFSVRGRDLGSAVLEAQQKIAEQVPLPGGYHLEWVGEFGNLKDAVQRLAVVVPLSLVLICVLLYFKFSSFTDMALAASVMPMALIGGVFALFLTGTPFSVSAAIGFIALFGIAAMDGIMVLSYYKSVQSANAACDDDVYCRLRWIITRSRIDRDRIASTKTAGTGCRRWNFVSATPNPGGAASVDRRFFAASNARRGQ
jgi:Cu/Ag efflux pump CusA